MTSIRGVENDPWVVNLCFFATGSMADVANRFVLADASFTLNKAEES